MATLESHRCVLYSVVAVMSVKLNATQCRSNPKRPLVRLYEIAFPLVALPRAIKRLVVIALDVLLAVMSVWIAIFLRFDQIGLPVAQQSFAYALAPLLAVPIFIRCGIYRAIFRYTGLSAMVATAKAVGFYALIFFIFLLFFRWEGVPRSIGLIQPLLFLIFVGSSRAIARSWLSGQSGSNATIDGRLLIYGAGEAGVQTASGLGVGNRFYLLGFIDDDPAKVGSSINGLDIMNTSNVADIVERMGATDILLAMPTLSRDRRNEIIERLGQLPVHVRTLPALADLASGKVSLQDFQELDVEDLLGRKPVKPDPALLSRNLTGHVVLVSGAGGSIGSELCRQIISERPTTLVLVDHSEFALYSIHRELLQICQAKNLQVILHPLLASMGHLSRLVEICRRFLPFSIYHAAAYKHVPLVEINPSEGVLNNVFGTLNMARAAIDCGASHFLLISTDKAVRPTNVMGASKRTAELLLQALSKEHKPKFEFGLITRPGGIVGGVIKYPLFSMVRFGNVLDSSGSVVPLFRDQLRRGGPVTVTHREVTRYFMTIAEAAQLVLQASAMALGGEVFVLDMGAPVKILDLARRMAKLSGLTLRDHSDPFGDVELVITGLRPGEKLYEELLIGGHPEKTEHERIMKATEDYFPWTELQTTLRNLYESALRGDDASVVETLALLVQGYHPTGIENIHS